MPSVNIDQRTANANQWIKAKRELETGENPDHDLTEIEKYLGIDIFEVKKAFKEIFGHEPSNYKKGCQHCGRHHKEHSEKELKEHIKARA